ncbi:MAG TPA: GNAT family N-acetyltransferase [Streptosporangiaceae bacterium]|jgi:ribosomal protein S18 acetylase RimI-like enzyme
MSPDTAQPTVQIRPLQPAEWATVRDVRLTALAESPGAFFATLEQEQAFDERKWRQRLAETAYFGAWEAGPQPRLTGLVATFPEVPADGTQADGTEADGSAGPAACWHLVAMWVSPDRRGQGVAERLVDAVCDLAQASGAARVALWVADANPRAQAFYRRLGFALSGERGLLRGNDPDSGEARMTLGLGSRPRA